MINELPVPIRQQANTYLTALENKGIGVSAYLLSGSRSQNLTTPDSDFDIFFIYSHPTQYYGSPFETALQEETNETIRYQGYQLKEKRLDMWGWDLRKFIRLMAESNLSALEAAHCPDDCIFRGDDFLKEIRNFFAPYFDFKKCATSYLKQAKNRSHTVTRYPGAPVEPYHYKEYLQAARCFLNALYISIHQSFPNLNAPELLITMRDEISVTDYDFINMVFEKRIEGGLLPSDFDERFKEWFDPKYLEVQNTLTSLPSDAPDVPIQQINEYFWHILTR